MLCISDFQERLILYFYNNLSYWTHKATIERNVHKTFRRRPGRLMYVQFSSSGQEFKLPNLVFHSKVSSQSNILNFSRNLDRHIIENDTKINTCILVIPQFNRVTIKLRYDENVGVDFCVIFNNIHCFLQLYFQQVFRGYFMVL